MSIRATGVPQPETAPANESAAAARFIATGGSKVARRIRQSTVDAYTRAFTDLTGWVEATAAQRLCASGEVRGLIAYLLLATAHPADADYVRSCRSAWGHHATLVYPHFAATFGRTAARLGFTTAETKHQWGALAKIIATTGTSPEVLDSHRFGAAATELTAAHSRPDGRIPRSWSTPLHGLTATLTAIGVLAEASTHQALAIEPHSALGRAGCPRP